MVYLRLEDRKQELLVGKMHLLVDGHGKCQFEELHSLDFQARIGVVALSLMKIGSQQRGIVLMSKFVNNKLLTVGKLTNIPKIKFCADKRR